MFPSETFDLGILTDQKKPYVSNFEDLDNLSFDFTSRPVQDTLKSTDFQSEDDEKGSRFASLGIVKDFASRSRKMNGENIHFASSNDEASDANDQKLSTTARIRIAGQQFIDTYSTKAEEISQLNHSLAVSFPGLSDDEAKDIELLLTLLVSAEKTGKKQFRRATKLIQLCSNRSLNEGNPVERLVYYFSEAIQMKINPELGRVASNVQDSMQMFNLEEALMNIDTSIFAFHQKVPLSQVCQFSSIHAIIENLKKARKIHIIDLEIRTGMQYIVMMQEISSRTEWHVDHIKITAIGLRSESKIKDTCKHLTDFAKTMNIPFGSKIVMVDDVLDLNVDLFDISEGEKVAVYAPFFLSYLIVKPNCLEYLMRLIRKINPCIMVITEVEANHTSPAFVNRFIEALFFYGALFDSLSDCLANDYLNRKVAESVFYGHSIRNIVAAEGDERTIRHIGLDVWRKFFQRFGMLKIQLSAATLNEAKLLIGNFNCGPGILVRFLLMVDVFLLDGKAYPSSLFLLGSLYDRWV